LSTFFRYPVLRKTGQGGLPHLAGLRKHQLLASVPQVIVGLV
jgi:hypothetical protein